MLTRRLSRQKFCDKLLLLSDPLWNISLKTIHLETTKRRNKSWPNCTLCGFRHIVNNSFMGADSASYGYRYIFNGSI